MTPERPWARHYMDVWLERSGDPRLPLFVRVSALAYGTHVDNGHASFGRGQVALVLGQPGEPYTEVGRVIRIAVAYGWLAPGSWYGCLIVPRHVALRGPYKTPKNCLRCERHAASNPASQAGFGSRSSAPQAGFEPRTPPPRPGSERKPLFLIWPEDGTDDSPQPGNDKHGQEEGA